MSDNGENRREFTRVRIQLDAEISSDDKASINGVAKDLSLNGVYIPSSGKLPIGTECTIALFLDGRDIRLEVTGKISRVNDDGMALEFTGVPLDDLEHLLVVGVVAPGGEQRVVRHPHRRHARHALEARHRAVLVDDEERGLRAPAAAVARNPQLRILGYTPPEARLEKRVAQA